MKYFLSALIILHGLIHLMGFAKAFELADLAQLTKSISKPVGLLWLIAAILLVFGGVLFVLENKITWLITGLGVLLSIILVITHWRDAKIGIIANLFILPAVLTLYGEWRMEHLVQSTVNNLFVTKADAPIVKQSDIQSMPSLVQLWLHNTSVIDKPVMPWVKITQKGSMRSSVESNWASFTAEHWASLDKPGFVWHAVMDAGPGIHVAVMDKFIEGHGSMMVRVQSLIPLSDVSGSEIDESALQRYLAEIVWNPSFATSPYITWEQLDNVRVKATMKYNNTVGSVIFTYNSKGLVHQVEADRYYYQKEGTTKEKWIVTIDLSSYQSFNGLLIPVKSSITWKLADGDFKWFELEIIDIQAVNR